MSIPTAKSILQQIVIVILLPLIVRECIGWGKIYSVFVGWFNRNWFWENARKRIIRGKLHKFLMELDISQWADRSTYFLERWYDLPAQEILKQALKNGDEVADIGANVGMFSLTARPYIENEGKVYAFEPNSRPREQFNRNIVINDICNIEIFPFALGETNGKFILYVPRVNSGEGSLAQVAYPDRDFYTSQEEIKIGDDDLKNSNLRIIKIDVEGSELSVLKGIRRLISKSRPLILLEYVPEHLKMFDTSINDILTFAKTNLYKCFQISEAKIAEEYKLSLTPIKNSKCHAGDILLSHKDDPYILEYYEHSNC